MFGAATVVRRIALTYDQVQAYNPPPNPAKLTDSRCKAYIKQFGNESWELDALNPTVIHDLITEHVDELTDFELLRSRKERLREEKDSMQQYLEMME